MNGQATTFLQDNGDDAVLQHLQEIRLHTSRKLGPGPKPGQIEPPVQEGRLRRGLDKVSYMYSENWIDGQSTPKDFQAVSTSGPALRRKTFSFRREPLNFSVVNEISTSSSNGAGNIVNQSIKSLYGDYLQ